MQEERKMLSGILAYLRNRKKSVTICTASFIFISGIWFHYVTLIDYEYQQDIQKTKTVAANLVLAYDENIRRNFENIDEVLGCVKTRS